MENSKEWTPQVAFCCICGVVGTFLRDRPSIRETFVCQNCRGSLRYRAQAAAILSLFDGEYISIAELTDSARWKSMQVYEPGIIGPFRKYMRGKPNYTNSFYWSDVAPGDSRDGVMCQDLMKMTFPDQSFDMVITSDIFEHIRKPMLAFAEIRRILRPGGHHVFSVPAQEPLAKRTRLRVDTSTDEDVPILPEVYHGSGNGGRSLVYTDFGEDIADTLTAIDFPTRCVLYRDTPTNALPRVATFISTRPAA
jgi:SAM-dependent methyltransferase